MIKETISITTLVLTFATLLTELNAQEPALMQKSKYSAGQLDDLFVQAISTLPETKIPFQYRSLISETSQFKCPTLLLFEVKQNFHLFPPDQQSLLKKIFARPQLPFSYVNATGQFRIHYATTGIDSVSSLDIDSNGVPDFVEEVALAMAKSFQIEVNDLQYREPPDDDGVDGPEYDIYIEALGNGIYGETFAENEVPETTRDDFSSYIRIDNDFENGQLTGGFDGARVTVAHEYFHAVQFGYKSPFNGPDARFYYELSATWMEDVVYDEINDYYRSSLPGYFETLNVPFNQFNNGTIYGESIWNHFLAEKYDDLGLLKRPWEMIEANNLVMEAIDRSLQEKNSSFRDDFAEFAVWNYFTAGRADPQKYYEEGGAYPEVVFSRSFDLDTVVSVTDSSRASTYEYYRFNVLNSGRVIVTGSANNPERGKLALIVTQPGNMVDFSISDINSVRDLGFIPSGAEIVVIPVNVQVLDGDDLPLLNRSFSTYNFMVQAAPDSSVEQGITAIYPNPFKLKQSGQLVFEFTPVSAADFEVQILTADGRVIKTANLADGSGALTASSFTWDGRDNSRMEVASGIYLFQLKQDKFHQFKKFAIIHE